MGTLHLRVLGGDSGASYKSQVPASTKFLQLYQKNPQVAKSRPTGSLELTVVNLKIIPPSPVAILPKVARGRSLS